MNTAKEWLGDILPVHVTNIAEMHAIPTEEQEPEHFVCETLVLTTSAGNTPNQPTLGLDLARKYVTILPIDQPVIICHSGNQASKPDNQVAGLPNPQGAYLPALTPLTLPGTGPLWIVPTLATQCRVSVVQGKRGA